VAVEVRTARDAAEALVRALRIVFGEVTIRVNAGQVTLLQHGTTLKPKELEEMVIPT
jgi:hypothetical protein